MCDDHAFDDMIEHNLRQGGISRRELGSLTLGAGIAFALPRAAGAADTTGSEVEIKTPDGTTDAYFVHPAAGRHAAVLVWPDIFGLRPAFRQMGKRLAESGYTVLVVNPFYRTKKAPTAPEKANFDDPETRKMLMGLAGTLSPATSRTDAQAFLGWLDRQEATDTKRKAGTTGYCMSGRIAIATAAALPDRIGAVASFHGGGLVTDQADSPHLLIPKTKARFLVAIARNDDEKEPKTKDILRDAFAKAGRPAEVEVYPAMHGWCPPDSAVYDVAQAEKAWARMMALFKESLA
ncbi:MAG TPA: dienelactone hydrolase family protein [Steroidobacteraceae bacterium]|nr:dienelactone hydrolase family protein [Steroidobacteraceae bacterium]